MKNKTGKRALANKRARVKLSLFLLRKVKRTRNFAGASTRVASALQKNRAQIQKQKTAFMTSVTHGGPICQDDYSATTLPQKSTRHAIGSLEPPLSGWCVEIAVSNAHRGRI